MQVFVGNIDWHATDDDLRGFFETAGFTVGLARILTDKETGKSRGFGFVTLEAHTDIQAVVDRLDKTKLLNRAVHIEAAKEQEHSKRSR